MVQKPRVFPEVCSPLCGTGEVFRFELVGGPEGGFPGRGVTEDEGFAKGEQVIPGGTGGEAEAIGLCGEGVNQEEEEGSEHTPD
jgi:hypothetical protein